MSSLSMNAVKLLLRLQDKTLADAEKFRQQVMGRSYPAPAPLPKALRARCAVREERVQGQPVYTLVPKAGRPAAHIIYTHGGAYVNPLLGAHWSIIGRLIALTGAAVTVPIYPLAPEHTHREAYAELERVYRDVRATTPAGSVVLAGDSAGGGLALGQALRYRDISLPAPDLVLLFSPWLDITLSNPDAAPVERRDVMLGIPGLVEAGRWWPAGTTRPRRCSARCSGTWPACRPSSCSRARTTSSSRTRAS